MTPESRRIARAFLSAALAAAALAAPASAALRAAPSGGDETRRPPAASPPKPLLERLRAGDVPNAESLLTELRALGPGPVRALLERALEPAVPTAASREKAARPHGVGVLEKVPALVLAELHDPNFPPELRAPSQEIALAVLEAVGDDTAELGLALELASANAETDGVRPEVLTLLSNALGAMLRRTPALVPTLASQVPSSNDALRPALLSGIGAAPGRDATRALTGYLGQWPALDATVLAQVGRRLGRAPVPLTHSEASVVRRFLRDSKPELRREAALALGRTETASSLPELIERLQDDAPSVCDAAHWALKAITGLRFARDAARWEAWLAGEETWWSERGETLAASFSDRSRETLAGAARELASHRGSRERISLALLPQLDLVDSPDAERLLLEVLASLRSPAAVRGLIERLPGASGAYRTAILATLTAITGESRSANPDDWSDWLRSGN